MSAEKADQLERENKILMARLELMEKMMKSQQSMAAPPPKPEKSNTELMLEQLSSRMAGMESQLKNQQSASMNDLGKEKPLENATPTDVNNEGEHASDVDNGSCSDKSDGDEEETITTPSGVTVPLIKLLYSKVHSVPCQYKIIYKIPYSLAPMQFGLYIYIPCNVLNLI